MLQVDPKKDSFSSNLCLSRAYGFNSGTLSPQVITQLQSSVLNTKVLLTPTEDPAAFSAEPLQSIIDIVDEEMEDQESSEVEGISDFDLGKITVKVKTHRSLDNSVIDIPAVDNYDTVLSLAKISANAYVEDPELSSASWYSVDPFLKEDGFGWDESAIRGYVYTNPEKTLVIMAIKGTSTMIFDRSGHTAGADKFNDNLMFSCCCARVDFSWDTVCPCFQNNSTCKQECLVEYSRKTRSFPFKKNITLLSDSLNENRTRTLEVTNIYPVYYYQAIKIYEQLKKDYPNATIWLTGHSLGGSLASLLAITYPGTAAVAFSAPGERLFAERLGLLPERRKNNTEMLDKLMQSLPIFHIYNTADPIPYGKCTGIWSLCYIAGYAMETKCHLGQVCEYDIGSGLPFDLQKHKLKYLIQNIIMAGHSPPPCRVQSDCFDCKGWNFV